MNPFRKVTSAKSSMFAVTYDDARTAYLWVDNASKADDYHLVDSDCPDATGARHVAFRYDHQDQARPVVTFRVRRDIEFMNESKDDRLDRRLDAAKNAKASMKAKFRQRPALPIPVSRRGGPPERPSVQRETFALPNVKPS